MYLDSHNAYVQQLHATNAMMETYHLETIPQLIQELEDIYNDLCATVSDVVLHSADVIATKVSISKCSSVVKKVLFWREFDKCLGLNN